jgi:hypothetical protein
MHPDKFLGRDSGQYGQQQPEMTPDEIDAHLEALSASIAGKRKEAIDFRKASGIEDVWLACEEAYLGIDDMNRAEFSGAKWAKPTSMTSGLTANVNKTDGTRSTAFVRLTSRYVDGAAAKLGEIILPIDEKAFQFKHSPVPDLVVPQEMQGTMPGMQPQQAMPPAQGMPPAPEGAMSGPAQAPQQPAMQGMPPPPAPVDPMVQAQKAAAEMAERAETRIYDWMTESKYPAEARKVIKDAARIGVGVLKGPFPVVRNKKAMVKQGEDAAMMEIKQSIAPAVQWVDPWNFYPADGCGENIHDGDYVFEKDFLSARKLKALKEEQGYLADRIDQVLEEGPNKAFLDSDRSDNRHVSKNRYEVWYYYGKITRKDLCCTAAVGYEDVPEEQEDVCAILTMVNDTVIRCIINPFDSGLFPYHVMSWSRRPGHWAGVGVGEKMMMPQRSVNAATRALFNNAGLSSGAQIIIDQLGIVPADGSWTLTPNKIWYKTGESPATNVRDAFVAILIPSVQKEMSAIIEYGMRLAEESTGIPLIAQGQQGPTTPQTFGQAEIQNNNSLTWLRDIGYCFDDQITEPLVDAYYEWLLLDPSVPENEKGDFAINAHGSIALVERAIQEQTMIGLLQVSQNPSFEIDPAKLFAEYLKSKRMDPSKILLSDEDKAKRAQMPQPAAPQIEAAKIRAEAEQAKTQMVLQAEAQKFQAESQLEMQRAQEDAQLARELAQLENQTQQIRIKTDTDRDTAFVEANVMRDRTNAQMQMQELAIKRELAMLDYANKREMTLEQVKAKLAETSLKLQTQKELSAASMGVDLHKHRNPSPQVISPPTEPAGKAPAGQAFAK